MEENGEDYTPEQLAQFADLEPARIAAVDARILDTVTSEWRKVAYIVGAVMWEIKEPDIVVAERVRVLVAAGRLESRGFIRRMHYSEMRLPQ